MTCRLHAYDIFSYCCAITAHVVKASKLINHWDEAVDESPARAARRGPLHLARVDAAS